MFAIICAIIDIYLMNWYNRTKLLDNCDMNHYYS